MLTSFAYIAIYIASETDASSRLDESIALPCFPRHSTRGLSFP